MFYFFYGSDRQKARAALNSAVERLKNMRVVQITDANAVDDLNAALQGGGMFAEKRVIILENVFENEAMHEMALGALSMMKAASDPFFILEEKPDAATKKQIEKYAETSQKFEAAKRAESGSSIFSLANALKRGDKKSLWIGYQRQLVSGDAPEAIHGVLFWAAKDMLLKSHSPSETADAKKLVVQLAALPHEARRAGEDLEYALERFALSLT
ncbi:MAG TPA: hypothetical protein VMU27_02275 [Candidatus Paceibacterota bacterium]|nr:hypothetical protein [Candidatus Paceibacterota bacterium]